MPRKRPKFGDLLEAEKSQWYTILPREKKGGCVYATFNRFAFNKAYFSNTNARWSEDGQPKIIELNESEVAERVDMWA